MEVVSFDAGLLEVIAAYGCVLARLSGVSWNLPVLGDQTVPTSVRTALVLPAAWIVLAGLGFPRLSPLPVPWALAAILGMELAFGLMLGFLLRWVLQAAEAGGRLISDVIGLGFGVFVDPASGAQSVATSRLLGLLAGLLVFTTNTHHDLLRALLRSFQLAQPGQLTSTALAMLSGGMVGVGTYFFDVMFRIAFPVIVVALAVYSVLAVVSRVIPQMNLFVFGFAVLIFAGLQVLALQLPQIAALLVSTLAQFATQSERWLTTGSVR
jgi:flagellar biosynthetic protein FliR